MHILQQTISHFAFIYASNYFTLAIHPNELVFGTKRCLNCANEKEGKMWIHTTKTKLIPFDVNVKEVGIN